MFANNVLFRLRYKIVKYLNSDYKNIARFESKNKIYRISAPGRRLYSRALFFREIRQQYRSNTLRFIIKRRDPIDI